MIRSEGVKLNTLTESGSNDFINEGRLNRNSQRAVGSKRLREVSFMRTHTTFQPASMESDFNYTGTGTPPGQGSLFNLTVNDTVPVTVCSVTNAEDTSSVSAHVRRREHDSSSTSLEGTVNGKRILLMHQSGQMISCTTLFDGPDTDDDDEPGAGNGRRRLQSNRPEWSFFPLFVEQERGDSSKDGVSMDKNLHQSPGTTDECGSTVAVERKKTGFFSRITQAFRNLGRRSVRYHNPQIEDVTDSKEYSTAMLRRTSVGSLSSRTYRLILWVCVLFD